MLLTLDGMARLQMHQAGYANEFPFSLPLKVVVIYEDDPGCLSLLYR